MAKSQRASSRKNNNQRLKRNVFGPVEAARTERLSAKLMELAAQPKESKMEDVSSEVAVGKYRYKGLNKFQIFGEYLHSHSYHAETEDTDKIETVDGDAKSAEMDVDAGAQTVKKQSGKVEKRRSKRTKSSIVFKTYQDKHGSKKRK
ncbi:hypothetical protein RB601_007590 [Gaeumannomyces tritici]